MQKKAINLGWEEMYDTNILICRAWLYLYEADILSRLSEKATAGLKYLANVAFWPACGGWPGLKLRETEEKYGELKKIRRSLAKLKLAGGVKASRRENVHLSAES